MAGKFVGFVEGEEGETEEDKTSVERPVGQERCKRPGRGRDADTKSVLGHNNHSIVEAEEYLLVDCLRYNNDKTECENGRDHRVFALRQYCGSDKGNNTNYTLSG